MSDLFGSTAFDVSIKLLAVLALIYGIAVILKRYTLGPGKGPIGIVRVLDATALGARKTIYVVEIGDRVLVLGATDANINALAEISDPDTVSDLISRAKPGWIGFRRQLELSMNRGGANPIGFSLQEPVGRLAQTVARLRGTGSSHEGPTAWGGKP